MGQEDNFELGESVTRLPCGHHFHRDCIVPWLEQNNTCPTCRHELRTDPSRVEEVETPNSGTVAVTIRRTAILERRRPPLPTADLLASERGELPAPQIASAPASTSISSSTSTSTSTSTSSTIPSASSS